MKGIQYFIQHPSLWAYLLSILLPQIVLTTFVFFTLFFSVNLVQSLLGLAFNGPVGLIIAWINFLHQVDVVSQLVSSFLLYPMPLQFLFDTVLSREGFDEVVVRGKLFRVVNVSRIVQLERWLFDLPNNLVTYPMTILNRILTIILTFAPIVGPVLLIFVNAPERGLSFHNRYYQLKGIDTRQKNAFYASRRFEYIGFGIVAGILQQIPFISTFFTFTTVTGAALWASQFESEFEKQRNGEYNYQTNQRISAFILGPNSAK